MRLERYSALDPCVHCGFCLPACPTYLVTGDEGHSPRGRIVLMRALERGEMSPHDPSLLEHLDACLGCRGCEPVCPSGVGTDAGSRLPENRSSRPVASRLSPGGSRRFSVPRDLAPAVRSCPRTPGHRPAQFLFRGRTASALAWACLASSAEQQFGGAAETDPKEVAEDRGPAPAASPTHPTVALFRGCVMNALFSHVHAATKRTLEVNGYRVVEVRGQVCCGALHEHAGDMAAARALAEANVAVLDEQG